MEKFPTYRSEDTQESSIVEHEVNFENNDSEILISRLRNPTIKQQIVDILHEEKLIYFNQITNEEWEPYLPEGWTGEERFELLKGRLSGRVVSTEDLETELKFIKKPNKKEIEGELDKEIGQIEAVTEIDYTSNGPTSSSIPLNWIVPWTGKKATPKQMSIIEAHEKGHRIRFYDSITGILRQAFDVSKVQFTEEDYDIIKKDIENHTDKPEDSEQELSLEEIREQYLNNYLFTGMEIAERMSQLKNYFGFRGDEKFTKSHLDYARAHYIEDTGMDNSMGLFFQGITPETEGKFIELINTSGI